MRKAFFVSERQEYLCYETLRSWFVRTTLGLRMRSTPDRRIPTIHGLRHHFAVERLTLWCQQGASPLICLSTWSRQSGRKLLVPQFHAGAPEGSGRFVPMLYHTPR